MQTLKIEATPRADFGKKASRAIRREGQVPCVLYGGGETVSFSVDAKALKPLIYTPNSYIVELTIGGKTEKAVMREVQFHPVREEILHIDFYRVQEGKPVAISIPVRLTGQRRGREGGRQARPLDPQDLRQRPGRQTARRDHRRRDDAGRGQDDLRGRPQIGRPEIPDPRHHGPFAPFA